MTEPLVSVVVSTRDRAEYLPRLVEALRRQTLTAGFEVVIVDDASTDDTPGVLERLVSDGDPTLRVMRLDRRAGAAAGRNAAWRIARGEIVAFTDDDCQPAPAWLANGVGAMTEADVVAGRTHPNPDQLDRLGPYARTMWPSFAETFPTCNVFYRRGDLEKVGGFDEAFGFSGGEDTELASRVRALGRTLTVRDDVVVYHDVHPGSFRAAARDTIRWSGIPLLFRKSAELRKLHLSAGIFWKSHQRVLLAVLGLALAPVTGVSVLLAGPWVVNHLRRKEEIPRLGARVASLPGAFALDVLQVGVLAVASVRHRSLVL